INEPSSRDAAQLHQRKWDVTLGGYRKWVNSVCGPSRTGGFARDGGDSWRCEFVSRICFLRVIWDFLFGTSEQNGGDRAFFRTRVGARSIYGHRGLLEAAGR